MMKAPQATPWNAALHPRDPSGRFRKVGVKPGWYPYRRGREIHLYYINDAGETLTGVNLVAMNAKVDPGNQFRGVDDADATERAHFMDSGDGEQMIVAANERGIAGVVYPDRIAPPEPCSLARYSGQNEQVEPSQYDKNFGGEPDQLADRSDGYVYDTLEAQHAYKMNEETFTNLDNRVWNVRPDDLAQQVVEARKWYQKNLGLTPGQARSQKVYAYVNGATGELKVVPAVRIDKDGNVISRHAPNTRGGGGAIKMRCEDLTRQARSLQTEGIKTMELAIVKGVDHPTQPGVQPKRHMANAIQYRALHVDRRTGESMVVWGTMEQKFSDYSVKTAQGRFTDENGNVDQKARRKWALEERANRRRMAKQYENPQSPQTASKLLRRLYTGTASQQGYGDYPPESIEMRKDGRFAYVSPSVPISNVYKPDGSVDGYEAQDARGFVYLYNRGKEGKDRIDESMVEEKPNGRYEVAYAQRDGSSVRKTFGRDVTPSED